MLQSVGPRDRQRAHYQHFTLVPNPSPITTNVISRRRHSSSPGFDSRLREPPCSISLDLVLEVARGKDQLGVVLLCPVEERQVFRGGGVTSVEAICMLALAV